MQKYTLDCQGLACPQPVLQCKQLLDETRPQDLEVIVDNQAARENVGRFLHSVNYNIADIDEQDGLIYLRSHPGQQTATQELHSADPGPKTARDREQNRISAERQLVFITSQYIGQGSDELGSRLMQNFMATLPEMDSSLWRLILINSGVKLAAAGNPALQYIQKLEELGIDILVCGTCLEYFQLLEKKQVGQTTNMLDVVTSLQLADKIIKL